MSRMYIVTATVILVTLLVLCQYQLLYPLPFTVTNATEPFESAESVESVNPITEPVESVESTESKQPPESTESTEATTTTTEIIDKNERMAANLARDNKLFTKYLELLHQVPCELGSQKYKSVDFWFKHRQESEISA